MKAVVSVDSTRSIVVLCMLCGCTLSASAWGNELPASPATNLTPATHHQLIELPRATEEAPVISFSQLPTQVGDRVAQRVGMEMGVETTITQSGQVAHEARTQMRRRQERKIEVLEVNEGRVVKAKVSFPLARIMTPDSEQPDREVAQPVEGNSYLVTRIDRERLKVTEMNGALPTRDEFELVVHSVSTLGLPNPLAEYLLTRSIRVGERLELPHSLAQEVLGFDQLGEVKTFALELKEIRSVDEQPCAVFVSQIQANGDASNPLQIDVTGEVIIEIATSRTIEASLTGPLTMHASENDFEYQADGSILVAIQSRYGSKRR